MKTGDLVYWHDATGIKDFGIVTKRRESDETLFGDNHWWIFWFLCCEELSLPDDEKPMENIERYAFCEADYLRFFKNAWFEVIKLHGDVK